MKKEYKPFIIQTAKDYDIDIDNVESIYRKYYPDILKFYEKLEKYIKDRRNKI